MIDRPDPIDAPLGRARDQAEGRAAAGRSGGFGSGRVWGLTAAGLGLVAFVAVVAATEPPAPGGRPQAVARIEVAPPPPVAPPVAAAAAAAPPSGPALSGAAMIEAASGVRVNRPAGMSAPGALIIEVPQGEGPAVALTPAPDPRLVEKSPQGPLPRVGGDGAKPSEVYARPVFTASTIKPGAPRIALYVGGLGLSAGATRAAIALPPDVTLAFAATGDGLAGSAAAAREAGHEILLQTPMEPPDYPANDPGPTTLLAASPAQNLQKLHSMMARFPGYVGIANHLGGRFLADEAALEPVLREIGRRGLIFVEDADPARSRAGALAGRAGLIALNADVVIDRGDKPASVKASLAELETLARERGVAIGAASALPNALGEIAQWAKGLEARGIALVPLSAMALSPPPPRTARRKF